MKTTNYFRKKSGFVGIILAATSLLLAFSPIVGKAAFAEKTNTTANLKLDGVLLNPANAEDANKLIAIGFKAGDKAFEVADTTDGIRYQIYSNLETGKTYELKVNTGYYIDKATGRYSGNQLLFPHGATNGDISFLGNFKFTILPLITLKKVELDVEVKTGNPPIGELIERVQGPNRIETALEIAKKTYGTKAKNIIIANGTDRASVDALAVGPLANELKAPILLVENTVSTNVLDYIRNSGVEKIYIAGGVGSVSEAIKTQILAEAGLATAKRLSGDNRYETSAEIAEELWDDFGYKKIVVLAHGVKIADALAASTYATQEKYPIILSDSVALDRDVKEELVEELVTQVVIVGGTSTIPNSVVTNAGLSIKDRIAGANREETSVKIANKLTTKKSIVIANGYREAVDALAAASLANKKQAPIILTGSRLTISQENLIKAVNSGHKYNGFVVGGISSVYVDIFDAVNALIVALPD